jgi:hypothetical protein
MNLTTKQLCYIFDLAGIHYEEPDESQMSDEWVVEEGEIKGEGDNEDYKGLICYSQEYPEEGAVALEE